MEKTELPTENIIRGEEILNYLPQRPPIVMVDAFWGMSDPDNSETEKAVSADNMFVDGLTGQLADGGIIEHIAQSAAFHIGYQAIAAGNAVPLGMIGSVDKLTISRLPRSGETMRTHITFTFRMGNINQVAAVTKCGEEQIAQCRMKLALV